MDGKIVNLGTQERLFYRPRLTVLVSKRGVSARKTIKKQPPETEKHCFKMLISRFSVVKIFHKNTRLLMSEKSAAIRKTIQNRQKLT